MRGYSSIKREVDKVIKRLLKEVVTYYGERLVSMAIFGSYARETYRQDSDLDILLIVEGLPDVRTKRVKEFFKADDIKAMTNASWVVNLTKGFIRKLE